MQTHQIRWFHPFSFSTQCFSGCIDRMPPASTRQTPVTSNKTNTTRTKVPVVSGGRLWLEKCCFKSDSFRRIGLRLDSKRTFRNMHGVIENRGYINLNTVVSLLDSNRISNFSAQAFGTRKEYYYTACFSPGSAKNYTFPTKWFVVYSRVGQYAFQFRSSDMNGTLSLNMYTAQLNAKAFWGSRTSSCTPIQKLQEFWIRMWRQVSTFGCSFIFILKPIYWFLENFFICAWRHVSVSWRT